MRFRLSAYKLCGFALVAVGLLCSGCSGASRATRSVPAVEVALGQPARGSAATTADAQRESVTSIHIVEPGQTLWRIAVIHGTTVEALARLNELTDVTRIEAGQRLIVPRPSTDERRARRASIRETLARFGSPLPGGRVLSAFGAARRSHRHAGVDIAGNSGAPVLATTAGRVVYSGSSMRGYGKTVILDHGDGLTSLYAHNSRLLVGVGDRVAAGQAIAQVGRSGNATTEHCHFEIREHDVPVDPMRYIEHTSEATR